MKTIPFMLDGPIRETGYNDDDFNEIVRLYENFFEKPPPGEGNKPSRAFAIQDALFNEELTPEEINNYANRDEWYTYDEKEKEWKMLW